MGFEQTVEFIEHNARLYDTAAVGNIQLEQLIKVTGVVDDQA